MKKLLLLSLIACLSCGNDEKIITQKHPRVNELEKTPVSAGTDLIITGEDLDDGIKVFLNDEEIILTEVKNTAVTLKIPTNAVSGKLEIKFSQVDYNTQFYLKILDKHWQSYQSTDYFQLDFVSDNVGFAKRVFGNFHIVDKTIDGGKTWTQVLKVSAATSLIEAVSSNVAFIRTSSNVIKKTTDGGNSWQDIQALDLGYLIQKLFFNNETEGYLLADKLGKSYLFKTIDGGFTWNKVLDLDNYSTYIEIVYFNNEDIVLLNKKSKEFVSTKDGGVNWIKKNFTLPYTNNPMVYYANNSDKIWIHLEDLINIPGGLYTTNNNGSVWELINYPKLAQRIVYMRFINEQKGFILTDEGGILYTNDSGKIWEVFYLNSESIYSATIFDNNLFISTGNEFLVKEIK